jgi:hypothetical protein
MGILPSSRHALLLAGLAFFIILVVGYGSDIVLEHHPGWMISDDLVLGAVAAFVVYHYEKQRARFLSEKLRVIRDMNSYVRNELQVLYASGEQPEKTRLSTVQRSVENIEWALRELLPGKETLPDAGTGDRPEHAEDALRRSA